MKRLLRNFKKKTSILLGGLTTSFIIAQNKVYAASGTESIDSFINFACDWLTKIRRSRSTSWWRNVFSCLAT